VLLFLARRLVLAFAALVVFSFLSFSVLVWKLPSPLTGRPVLAEYWHWLRGIPGGGSLTNGLAGPIFPSLMSAFGHTAALLGFALALVVVLSVALGTAGALSEKGALGGVLRGASYLAWAVPPFLLALLVEELVATVGGPKGLGPFPIAGWPGSCPAPLGLDAGTLDPCPGAGTGLGYLVSLLRHLTLPAVSLSVGFVGLHSRYLRSSLLVALAAPYTTTARAKGLSERSVVLRHALRNSLATFAAVVLADFGSLFGAALAIDWIFQLNGIGSLFLRELQVSALSSGSVSLDVYAIEALLLVTALVLLASSLASDLVLTVLDPRVERA
jgi:peptide/nickel transport system permease protein